VKESWGRWKPEHSTTEADWEQMSDVFDVKRRSLEETSLEERRK
jgi:Spy/CpxP family protein refolding chaperone